MPAASTESESPASPASPTPPAATEKPASKTALLYRRLYKRQRDAANGSADPEDRKWIGYGTTNHGAHLIPWIINWAASVLLDRSEVMVIDLGCGNGEAVRNLRACGIEAVGLDVACPGADVHAEIADAPTALHDRIMHVGYHQRLACGFDVLEHLPEDELDDAFLAMRALAPIFALSIGYGPAVSQFEGENLHATQHDEFWWLERIAAAGGKVYRLPSGYLLGRWEGEAPKSAFLRMR